MFIKLDIPHTYSTTKLACGVVIAHNARLFLAHWLIFSCDTQYTQSGINSSHTHNLAKSQSYRGLKFLLSDTKFMTTVNSMLNYHRFQGN